MDAIAIGWGLAMLGLFIMIGVFSLGSDIKEAARILRNRSP